MLKWYRTRIKYHQYLHIIRIFGSDRIEKIFNSNLYYYNILFVFVFENIPFKKIRILIRFHPYVLRRTGLVFRGELGCRHMVEELRKADTTSRRPWGRRCSYFNWRRCHCRRNRGRMDDVWIWAHGLMNWPEAWHRVACAKSIFFVQSALQSGLDLRPSNFLSLY